VAAGPQQFSPVSRMFQQYGDPIGAPMAIVTTTTQMDFPGLMVSGNRRADQLKRIDLWPELVALKVNGINASMGKIELLQLYQKHVEAMKAEAIGIYNPGDELIRATLQANQAG
jgi:hypothetical protein